MSDDKLFHTAEEYHSIREQRKPLTKLLYITLCGIDEVIIHEYQKADGFWIPADQTFNNVAINTAVENAMIFYDNLEKSWDVLCHHKYVNKIQTLACCILRIIFPAPRIVSGKGWFDPQKISVNLNKKYYHFIKYIYYNASGKWNLIRYAEEWLEQNKPAESPHHSIRIRQDADMSNKNVEMLSDDSDGF